MRGSFLAALAHAVVVSTVPALALAQEAPGAVPAGPPPTAPAPAGVLVHVESEGAGAALERKEGTEWRTVCAAPCDRAVAPDGQYRVGGDGLRPTDPFALPAVGAARIDASMAGSGKRTAGIVLVILGSALTVAGGIFVGLGVAMATSSTGGDFGGAAIGGGALAIGGAVGAVTGLGLLIPGIVIAAWSSSDAVVTPLTLGASGALRVGPAGLRVSF